MAPLPGDYYRRLRLSQDASRREIKVAFRRLARQYHPDLHPNNPESAAKFQAIREAYEVLIDRVQREHYDRQQAKQVRTGGRNTDTDGTSTGSANTGHARSRKRARASQPKTYTEFYIRGVRHALDRRYREALRDYTKAITLEPQLSEAYLRRAEVFYVQGNDTRVLDNCQQAILLNSTEAKTYYYQGLSRYRLGYVESALAAFTDAITCDPDDARYHYRRGIAHQDLRESKAAAQDFRRASQLYRQQGDLASAQAAQTHLKSLGSIGQPLLLRLIIKGLLILTWPVRKPFSKLFPHRSHPQNHTSYPRDNHLKDSHLKDSHLKNNHPRNKRSSNPRQAAYTPYPKDTYSNPRHRAARSHPSAKHHRSGRQQYWAPGISSRPNGNYPYPPKNFSSGIFNTLKLMSNPAGETVPFYYQLADARQATLIGYALAVLANLCVVLGATQYFETTTWLAASRFWAAGGLAFVAMVFVLSLTRMKSRMRGLWAANVYILGASVIPLGFLFVVLAGIHHLIPYLPSQWPPQVALIGMLIAILWAFSHSLIALRSGLWRIQSFSSSTSAWFAPVLLGLGMGTGLLVWQLLATSFMITPTGTAIV
ncbi:MAG: DnaJ domain-containing protein [Cyanobacteria bacterium J06631_9]